MGFAGSLEFAVVPMSLERIREVFPGTVVAPGLMVAATEVIEMFAGLRFGIAISSQSLPPRIGPSPV
jgi:hypothetical protein